MVYRKVLPDGSRKLYYVDPIVQWYPNPYIGTYTPEDLAFLGQVKYCPWIGKYLGGEWYFDFPEAAARHLRIGDRNPVMASGWASEDAREAAKSLPGEVA